MPSSSHGSTPSHHPTHTTFAFLRKGILTTACPGQRVLNIETLPSGKSFSNRICFVDVSLESIGTIFRTGQSSNRNLVPFAFWKSIAQMSQCLGSLLVLKTDSLFATARVAGLLPPRSVAVQDSSSLAGTDPGGRGWVLMTRRPGRLIGTERPARSAQRKFLCDNLQGIQVSGGKGCLDHIYQGCQRCARGAPRA